MKKIILDTNILLIPYTQKVDIFSEFDRILDEPYNLFIIDQTVDELKKITENQKGKHIKNQLNKRFTDLKVSPIRSTDSKSHNKNHNKNHTKR